jgi:hypothetical protein
MPKRALPFRVAAAGCLRGLMAGVLGLISILAIDGRCAAQSSRSDGVDAADRIGGELAQDRIEPDAQAAWIVADARRRFAGIPGLPGWAGALYLGNAGRQVVLGAGWPLAQGSRWRSAIGLQISPSIVPALGSDRIDAIGPGVGLMDRLGEAAAPSPFGMLMSPIATSHPVFHRYTELTLASRDVLVAGDRLTLQAGSDLHFVLQEMGMVSWASDAAAMIGWRTRLQLRWSRPSALGEFSLEARVDRRADQLGRGQVEMRWQGHL